LVFIKVLAMHCLQSSRPIL